MVHLSHLKNSLNLENFTKFFRLLIPYCPDCRTGEFCIFAKFSLNKIFSIMMFSLFLFIFSLSSVVASSALINVTDQANIQFSDFEVISDETDKIIDWRINDESFAVLNLPMQYPLSDYSTYANTISFSNAYLAAEGYLHKTSYLFKGANEVRILSNAALNPLKNSWTIEAWIKPDNINSVSYIVSKRTTSNPYMQYGIGISDGTLKYLPGKKVFCSFGTLLGSNFHDFATVINVVDGNWHHVVCKVTYGAGIELFIDGVAVQTTVIRNQGWVEVNSSDMVTIGSGNGQLFYKGFIDTVRIYKKALKNEQIASLYNQKNKRILSSEINLGESWSITTTPYSDTFTSNSLSLDDFLSQSTIFSLIPINTSEVNIYDLGFIGLNQNLKNIVNWKTNAKSIIALNMPFELASQQATQTQIRDYSGSKNNGFVTNAVFKQGGGYTNKSDAFQFNKNSYITVKNSPNLNLVTNFTAMAWVKLDNLAGWQGLFGKVKSISTGFSGWNLNYDLTSQSFAAAVGCGAQKEIIIADTYADYLLWHHIALRSENGVSTLFIDGKKQFKSSAVPICDSGEDFFIGRYYSNIDYHYLNGKVDELLIFKKALSEQQIQNIYSSGNMKILHQETVQNDIWSADVTTNNGTSDIAISKTNNIIINDAAPIITSKTPERKYQWINQEQIMDFKINTCIDQGDAVNYQWVINSTFFNSVIGTDKLFTFIASDYFPGRYNLQGICFDGNGNIDTINYVIEVLAADDFAIVVPSNLQYHSQFSPLILEEQTKWVASVKNNLNISFVSYSGDIVMNGGSQPFWKNIQKGLQYLDNILPYAVSIGNHDYDANLIENNLGDRTSKNFEQYLPLAKYSSQSWWGGQKLNTSVNSYQFFSRNNIDFMIMHLEFCPSDETLQWANAIVSNNADKKVIIVTHAYLNFDEKLLTKGVYLSCEKFLKSSFILGIDKNDGLDVWKEFVKLQSNIFMVISGHVLGDGEAYLVDTGINGNVVHQFFHNSYSDYTGDNKLNAYSSIYIFKPATNEVLVRTYDPYFDQLKTINNHEFSFPIDIFN